MQDAILILVTAGTPENAEAIASALVEQQLAACVAIVPICSVYRWQGVVERDDEWQLTIKTTRTQLAAVQDIVQKLHTYELPEVLAIPVLGGSEDYLTWLTQQVR